MRKTICRLSLAPNSVSDSSGSATDIYVSHPNYDVEVHMHGINIIIRFPLSSVNVFQNAGFNDFFQVKKMVN